MSAGAVLAALAAWFVAVQRPFPPHTLVMATGPAGGAYADVGLRYREILGRHGIEVPDERVAAGKRPEGTIRLAATTVGESVVLEISDDGRGMDAAAIARRARAAGVAVVEPLWVFCRGLPRRRARLADGQAHVDRPRGQRHPPPGPRLLALNGVEPGRIELLACPRRGGEKLLRRDRRGRDPDLVGQHRRAPAAGRARRDPGELSCADAYVALDPFMNKVVVPTGVGDLANNRPPRTLR